MKGLTPEEYWALERLLLPVGSRPFCAIGCKENELRDQLVEQGRAVYTRYAVPPLNERGGRTQGWFELTPAGREALRLWPAVRDALGAA